jgi:hypothetical protein
MCCVKVFSALDLLKEYHYILVLYWYIKHFYGIEKIKNMLIYLCIKIIVILQ